MSAAGPKNTPQSLRRLAAILDCLELYGFDGDSLGDECHEWIERLPMPEMTEHEKARIEAIREQARQFGIEVELPDQCRRSSRSL